MPFKSKIWHRKETKGYGQQKLWREIYKINK